MQSECDETSATVRRRFEAAPSVVFAAFADPGLVERWLKPSPEVLLEVLAYDFAPSGHYRFAYTTPGEPLMHVSGTFALIEAPSRIVFSWNIEPPDRHAGVSSEVRVSIASIAGGAELTIQHVNLSRLGAPRRHVDGWRGALEGLAAFVAQSPGPR